MIARRRWLRLAALLAIGAPATRAQGRVFRIGYLMPRSGPGAIDDAFVGRMAELGYVAGRNLAIDYRWAAFDAARLQAMADELARARVDVIVTATTAGTRAAMRATKTLPIVMAATADPVAAGLVSSLARPGGNVTGVSLQTTDVAWKRLQLTREMVPGAARIALLAEKVRDGAHGTTALLAAETGAAASRMGVALVVRQVSTADELDAAFAGFRREDVQALIVQVSPLMLEHRHKIAELAARAQLPAVYEARNFVDAGGLASYGPDLRDSYRRAAGYVDRILRGAKPQELPVEQPEKPELVINRAAANALKLRIAPELMLRADVVVD